jgi:hypothetical protein
VILIPVLAGTLLVLSGLVSPSPFPQAAGPGTPSAPARDRILLIGGRTFAEGGRVIEALDAMVAASGVVGDSRFELLPDAKLTDEELGQVLEGQTDLRAIIAVVGDLSVMRGIDPNRDIPDDQRALSSRQIDEVELNAAMDRLEACAQRLGTHLVFSTAPLGLQGRVETPELLRVADIVDERARVLHLAADFRMRESASLFANGIDQLDNLGHEEAARLMFHRLCRDETFLPSRNDDERIARAGQRALDAWLMADEPRFLSAMAEATRHTPGTRLGAVREAALYAARDGLLASCERWTAAGPLQGPCAIPGLSIARLLCRQTTEPQTSCDPFEQELLAVAMPILEARWIDAWRLATEVVDRHPNRTEAWITLEAAARASGHEPGALAEGALPSLSAGGWKPVSEARAVAILRERAAGMTWLPVLLVASAPYAGQTPTGPILERLKRDYRQGWHARALNIWGRDTRGLLIPPVWSAELERLKATSQN